MGWNEAGEWIIDNAGAIGTAIGGGLLGSQGTSDQTTEVKPYLFPGQEKGITDFLNASARQYNQGGPRYYPRQTVANLDPYKVQGQNAALGNVAAQDYLGANMAARAAQLAGGGGSKVGGFQLQDQIGFGIDPGLQNAVANPVMRQLQERILPSLDLQATQQGAFGGSRQAQMKGQAAADATERMTEALARANLQARGQSIGQRAGDISAQLGGRAQDIQQNNIANNAAASGLAYMPAAQSALQAGANTMQDVGNQRTLYDQSLISSDVGRWDFNQNRPVTNLTLLGNRLAQPSFGGYDRTVQGQPGSATNILGGVYAGWNIGDSLFNTSQQQSVPSRPSGGYAWESMTPGDFQTYLNN